MSDKIIELSKRILKQGFRVFLSGDKEHGFYTDKEGTKVISFQLRFFEPCFSGNYASEEPKATGTGWRITDGYVDHFKDVFNASPPRWAVRSVPWRYTTMKEHLKTYGRSSRYEEVTL